MIAVQLDAMCRRVSDSVQTVCVYDANHLGANVKVKEIAEPACFIEVHLHVSTIHLL